MESLDPEPVPDPIPAAEPPPVAPPPPPGRFSTGQTLLLAALVIMAIAGVALGALVLLFWMPTLASILSAPPTEQHVVSRLVYDDGRGDAISEEFDVPRGCTKIILYYEAEPNDHGVDVSWISFRVYDQAISDYSIDNSGPHDLLDSDAGSSRLTLPAGSTYYVETTSFNATWSYRINCE